MRYKIMLSIVIPVYNSQEYLEECIKSIINYKKDDVEIILIDDGSTDLSPEICDNYSIKDKRIKVIHKKNSGVSDARNKGIETAIGKYIMFVDSDDLLVTNWNKILRPEMEKDIYYIARNVEENVTKIDMLTYIVGSNDKKMCLAAPYSKIYRTDFLKKNKIEFNNGLINGEDMLFNLDALIRCGSFEIINDSYYQYRIFQGSATKRFDDRIIESDKVFHKELCNILNSFEVEKKVADNISLYCIQMAIIILLNRIAYIKGYRNAKKYFDFLKVEPYKTAIHRSSKIDKKFKIIILFMRCKYYYFIYRSLRTMILINNKIGKKYYLINI